MFDSIHIKYIDNVKVFQFLGSKPPHPLIRGSVLGPTKGAEPPTSELAMDPQFSVPPWLMFYSVDIKCVQNVILCCRIARLAEVFGQSVFELCAKVTALNDIRSVCTIFP